MNLDQQREIPFGRPWIDEIDKEAVLEVLNGHILTHGPKCKEFEEKFVQFTKGGYAITTSSCMASLHLAAIYFGLRPGDEVIVPAQTHVATVHAVELMGARPIFVDCELETGNINLNSLKERITSKTKAIFVVHFAGIPAPMDEICEIAQKHDIKVVEDCALALGAFYKGKHVGLWGDLGCFSFYPVKHMTTGEGGMLISEDNSLIQKIGSFRAFNVDRSHSERQIPGIYDVIGVGLNYRMSELQAALGCTQIAKMRLNLEIRRKNFRNLKKSLEQLGDLKVLDSLHEEMQNSFYCLVVILPENLIDKRNQIVMRLKENGVGCSIYYPQPVNRMKYYSEKYGYCSQEFRNAERISDGSIALPVGPHLIEDDIYEIINRFEKILNEV